MEKLVAVLNPDGTYVGTSAPSGTQDVAITGQPIAVSGTVTANVGTGTQPVSGTVNAISTAPAGLRCLTLPNAKRDSVGGCAAQGRAGQATQG